MKLKNSVLRRLLPLTEAHFGAAAAHHALPDAQARYDTRCAAHAQDKKAVRTHTFGTLYPYICLYEALQAAGIDKSEALAFLDESASKLAEPKAASMRALCKLPGMYRLMPKIFKIVTLQQFGEAAGFRATFYDVGKTRVKFDMTKCLYCEVCRAEGCPELTRIFCHTDDVTDGNIHPRLKWNRTKIMGDGGDVCDFDLIVTDKP